MGEMAKISSGIQRALSTLLMSAYFFALHTVSTSDCVDAAPIRQLSSLRKFSSPGFIAAAQDGAPIIKIEDVRAEPGTRATMIIRHQPGGANLNAAQAKPAFVMFEGLPAGFELSKGFKTGKVWAVDFDDISFLSLQPPDGFAGELTILARVHAVDGTTISVSTFSASFMPRTHVTTSSTKPASRDDVNPMPPSRTAKLSSEEQLRLLEKAKQHMTAGVIAAARMIYKKLADEGNAQAAYELAQTFDPDFLKGAAIVGLNPDIDQARKWYQKAAEMGLDSARAKVIAVSPAHGQTALDPSSEKMAAAFETFLEEYTKNTGSSVMTSKQRDALYDEFRKWWIEKRKPPSQ
jgi:hypothetical protein